MKKLLFIALFALIGVTSFAQGRTFTLGPVNQGLATSTKSGWGVNVGDSIGVSDTLTYILPINHANTLSIAGQLNWTKIGAGTATVTAKYFQSEDNSNYTALLKGVANSTYTNTYTFSATGSQIFDFAKDTVFFSSRYLKIQYITSNTANVTANANTLIRPLIK